MDPDQSTDNSLVLAEYDYLGDEHRHYNLLIHTSFYLDVIFLGAVLKLVPSGTGLRKALVLGFAFVVTVALCLWTWVSVTRRQRVKRRKDALQRRLAADSSDDGFEPFEIDALGFERTGRDVTLRDLRREDGKVLLLLSGYALQAAFVLGWTVLAVGAALSALPP